MTTQAQEGLPAAVQNAVAAIHPGAPFVMPKLNLAEVDAALATISNILPIVATFFPPLKVAVPFLPILAGLVKMAEEIQAAHASGGDIGAVLAAHLEMFAAQTRQISAPKTAP